MQRVSILCAGAFFFLSFVTHRPQSFIGCLPEAIKPSDVVTSRLVGSSKAVKKVTVEEKLIQLKASCKNAKLVDAAGKEIRFFRLEGCWGNPPADYQEILQRQSDELDRLKRHYTVIEMTCNPDGMAIP